MSESTADLLDRADGLASHGRKLDAIAELTRCNREQRDPEIERRLVRLRAEAWHDLDGSRTPDAASETPSDRFAGVEGIPEIAVADFDAATLRSAIHFHGALIVRGFISPRSCERLGDGIDRAWEAIRRFRRTKQPDPAWFEPLNPGGANVMRARAWGLDSGTSYVADSPRLFFDLLEAFDEVGMRELVHAYFGEPPVLSLVKTAQRRLPPHATGAWHQDASVYGTVAHALDCWIPLSRCGDIAPGLDMWPRRLDTVIETRDNGTAAFATSPERVAELTAEVPAVRPVFEPGDAAIFDEMLLHRTASSQDYTQERSGIECWFFAPSTFPDPDVRIPIVY